MAREYLGIITEPADHRVGRFSVKGLPAVTEEDDRAELRVSPKTRSATNRVIH